jgi:hypothetical protein
MDGHGYGAKRQMLSCLGASTKATGARGLGVKDHNLLGLALQVRWLWLQCTDPSRPWASVPVVEDVMTTMFFKASVSCLVDDGSSILFWDDPWLDGRSIQDFAPDLWAVVPKRFRCSRTVASALLGNTWICDIVGPYTVPVLVQYVQLGERLMDLVLDSESQDLFIWRWCSSGQYS